MSTVSLTSNEKNCIDSFSAPCHLNDYTLDFKILLKESFLQEHYKKRKFEESMSPVELIQHQLENQTISNRNFKKPVGRRCWVKNITDASFQQK